MYMPHKTFYSKISLRIYGRTMILAWRGELFVYVLKYSLVRA